MEKEITGQKKIVLEILKENYPLRTEQVKILAMRQGVSCADRYLRWLSEEGLITSYREKGNATKTWAIVVAREPVYRVEGNGQLLLNRKT